jgi:Protein of unknown function (DUF3047)
VGRWLRWGAYGVALILAGCAVPTAQAPAVDASNEWQPVLLPGKAATRYEWSAKEGVRAVKARADRSASLWERRLQRSPESLGAVEFSWWADSILGDANVAEAGLTDAPARVMFAFDGDTARLPARTRLQLELAKTLTGRALPYATLAYVWDAKAPVGTVIVHPRNDRVRKIVVESGGKHTRQWRKYRRNLTEDFKLAFGEAPGRLTSIALMTDADNVSGMAQTWYGDVVLE